MKILQLAPRFPYPTDDGGKIGIANITFQFAEKGHEVTFFCYNHLELKEKDIEEFKKYCDLIIFEHSTVNTKKKIIKSFFLNKSLYLTKHINDSIKSFFDDIMSKKRFDIIHCDHTAMAPLGLYLKNKFKIPVGLRLHNLEWMIWGRYTETISKLNPLRIYINQQAQLLKSYESKAIEQCDVNFVITDLDINRAKELSENSNIVLASAGVNLVEWSSDDTIERDSYELVIASVFNWIHNVNGVKWFILKVLPRLKKDFPEVKLKIIGKYIPEYFSDYKELGVDVVGYVDKVQPYYNHASIFINPLFVGGGIRIKILEALSMKLPVVATKIAAEGINCKAEEGLHLADTPEDFYNEIALLLKNPINARKQGDRARQFIEKNHSWDSISNTMLNSYKEILNKNY